MLVAVDIGNTNVHVGLAEGGLMAQARLFPKTPNVSPEEFQVSLSAALEGVSPEAVIVSSVVRGGVDLVRRTCISLWAGIDVVEATPEMDLGIRSDVQPAAKVGIDRLLAAGEAYALAGGAVVLVGVGTAITVDAVSSDGRFVGGTISPGLRTKLQSLSDRTSLLPLVDLKAPAAFPGKETGESILAGVVIGSAGAVDRLVEELKLVVGGGAAVMVTGGDGPFLSPYLKTEHQVLESLVLRGLVTTFERARVG